MPKVLSEPDVREFRDRVCEAATHLFAEHGAEDVTMREVARVLGVSPMTPYRYFRDKDEILAVVRARAFDRFAEALEQAYAVKGDALSRSRSVGEAYMRFAFGEPHAYRLMFDLNQPGEAQYPDLLRATARARATMSDHVRGLIEAGIIAGDAELIGHVFWAALHGAIVLQFAGKLTEGRDFARIAEASFQALMRGFAPPAAVK